MATWTIFKRLNVSPASFPTVIHIKQYSSDFILKFQLFSTDGDLNIEAGATTRIRGTKRDGNGFELTGTRIGRTCTFSGTKAQMQQMTAVAGTNVFEVVVETETRELITATFHVEVQRAAMDAGTVTSESIIEEFADFQSKITAATQAAESAEASAEAAAESARTLTIDSTLTQSGQAADAKAVGDEIEGVKRDLSAYGNVAFFDVADSGYIATNVSPNNTVDPTVQSNNAFRHTIIQVAEGDKITINGTGWTTGRLWCFTDDNYVVKAVSGQRVIANNLVLTAPSGATKLIINMDATTVGTCYKGVQAVQVDSTLTVAGRAADAKETGDRIDGVGDRIDGVKSELETDTGVKHITFTPKYYIATNKAAGTEVDLTPVLNSSFSYAIIPVSEGEQITIHGRGWTTGKLWCFIDDENIVVSVSGQNVIATDGLELTVPANATKLIINSYTEYLGDCYKGELVPDIAAKAKSAFVYADSNVIIENETLTEDRTFTINPDKNFYKNIIVTVDAEFTASDTSSPTIHAVRYWLASDGVHVRPYYQSPHYMIGDNGKRKTNQFRFPCGVYGMQNYVFTITVPSGCTLTIHSLSLTYDDFVSRDSFIQLNAHGVCGFGGCTNTNLSFNMAAKLGYKYCITIPKVTSDGVYVCFHDDTGIQGQAKNPDGTDIDSQYYDIPISGFTYNQLLQFDFGVQRGMIFKGEKIPLLSDFFKICAETGMHPMLSVHPSLSGHWENIKAMAQKYNVLDKLNIKAPEGSTLTAPMSVLLNDVESYTVDINNSTTDAVEYMDGLVSTYNINTSKVKVGIEYFLAYATDENIASALNNGYFVSVANFSVNDVYSQYTSFIEKGVTQFTDDYMPCVGLNWY